MLDAEVIALFAERVRPEVRALVDEQTRGLEELLRRRQQLIEMLTAERNRRAACSDKRVRAGIERHLAWLKDQIKDS
ncbi:IS110 family transposase, partial [Shewanella algae]